LFRRSIARLKPRGPSSSCRRRSIDWKVRAHRVDLIGPTRLEYKQWRCRYSTRGTKRHGNNLSSYTRNLFLFLFFSRLRSEGWPRHGRTFSIYTCPLSFWLTLPRRVLFTSWCCPSRPWVVFLACVHLVLFLALSLSTGNSLVSSWCDHSMLASLLWRCLTVPALLQLC